MADSRGDLRERVLAAGRELIVHHSARKVTVSDIALSAGVGKGTVYLYWPSKEELTAAIFARELASELDQIVIELRNDPALVVPSRLIPHIIARYSSRPLARQLLQGDDYLLRLLSKSSNHAAFAVGNPVNLALQALPVLRREGLARSDRELASQAYGLHALVAGMLTLALSGSELEHDVPVPAAQGWAIHDLLGTDAATSVACDRARDTVVELLEAGARSLRGEGVPTDAA